MTVYTLGLLCLAALGHGYLWIAPVNRLHGLSGPRILIDLGTYLCLAAFLVIPLFVLWDSTTWDSADWDLQSWKRGWSATYVHLCALWGILKLVKLWWGHCPESGAHLVVRNNERFVTLPEDCLRRQHVGVFSRLLSLVPGNQVLRVSVSHKRLVIPRLHKSHEGLTIAHISDFHMSGRIGPKWFVGVCEEVNRLKPDLMTITGDLLENESCWSWLGDSLGALRAKYGVFYVLGNHDDFVDTDRTKDILTKHGLRYVSEQWEVLDCNGAPVLLAGNERPWGDQAADLSEAPQRDEQLLPLRVLLLHTPDQFSWAMNNDADLVLAGHTHDGQVRLPVLGAVACPSLYGTRYAGGVFRWDNMVMHVTRGISGKTPLRINCPPQIALLELVAPETDR